jgi:hypothetical protein
VGFEPTGDLSAASGFQDSALSAQPCSFPWAVRQYGAPPRAEATLGRDPPLFFEFEIVCALLTSFLLAGDLVFYSLARMGTLVSE